MVARSRRIEWAEAAHQALDEVLVYAVQQSPDGAARILIQALGPEVGHHHRAVGDHRRGGVAAALVAMVEDRALVRGALSEDGPGGQIKGQHLHRVQRVDADAVRMHPGLAFHDVDRRFVVGRCWPFLDVGGQE